MGHSRLNWTLEVTIPSILVVTYAQIVEIRGRFARLEADRGGVEQKV